MLEFTREYPDFHPYSVIVLVLAQEEAKLQMWPHINSAHIMGGLIRHPLAGPVLQREGVDLDIERFRAGVEWVVGKGDIEVEVPEFSSEAIKRIERARANAARQESLVLPSHLYSSVINRTIVGGALEHMGLTLKRLRDISVVEKLQAVEQAALLTNTQI